MRSSVHWDSDPSHSPLREFALYAVTGLFGGFLVTITLAGLYVLSQAVAAREFEILALVALLALVGGPLSILYLWPMLTDPDQRPPLVLPDWQPRPSRLVVAIILGAGFASATTVLVDGGHLLVFAVWFLFVFVVSITGTSGRIDPDTDTISVDGRTGTLSSVHSVYRLDVGTWTGFLLTYRPAPASAPRIVVVPEAVADDAHSLLEFGAALDFANENAPSWLGRRPLGIAAGGCLLVALGFVYVGGTYANSPMALAPGVGLFGVLGLLFVWLAFER